MIKDILIYTAVSFFGLLYFAFCAMGAWLLIFGDSWRKFIQEERELP